MASQAHVVELVGAGHVVELIKVRAAARSGAAKDARLAAGLSLTEVAAAVGVTPAAVFRWEKGDRVPRGEAALRYARLLNRLGRICPS